MKQNPAHVSKNLGNTENWEKSKIGTRCRGSVCKQVLSRIHGFRRNKHAYTNLEKTVCSYRRNRVGDVIIAFNNFLDLIASINRGD